MSCAYLTNRDIEKIVAAAVRLDEKGQKPSPQIIADIADGDEDIPELIKNMAKIRFMLWTSFEGGIRLLELERALDLEDMGDKNDPFLSAVLQIRVRGYDLNFTETPGQLRLYVTVDQLEAGTYYQMEMEGSRFYRSLSASEVLLMAQDLREAAS